MATVWSWYKVSICVCDVLSASHGGWGANIARIRHKHMCDSTHTHIRIRTHFVAFTCIPISPEFTCSMPHSDKIIQKCWRKRGHMKNATIYNWCTHTFKVILIALYVRLPAVVVAFILIPVLLFPLPLPRAFNFNALARLFFCSRPFQLSFRG